MATEEIGDTLQSINRTSFDPSGTGQNGQEDQRAPFMMVTHMHFPCEQNFPGWWGDVSCCLYPAQTPSEPHDKHLTTLPLSSEHELQA